MPIFSIECEQSLGMAHFGGEVIAEGESTVELTDEEVGSLVDLIREKEATNVDDLELAQRFPEIYNKLDDAYRDMAYRAEETHWLWEGYHNGYFEYDTDELMDYCEKELGFKFEYDIKDYYWDDEEDLEEGEEPEINEDQLMDDKCEAFSEWLDDYLTGLSDDEACRFFYEHMHADLDLDNVEYEVGIPTAIIEMVQDK